MSNRPTPPSVTEYSIGEHERLLARIEEQAREIERLRLNIADYNEHERCYQAEIAALKARPSDVVLDWLRDDESITDRLKLAGWAATHDAQWDGAEILRCEILQALTAKTDHSAQSGPCDRIDSGSSFSLDDLCALIDTSDRDTQALRMAHLMTGHADRSGDCFKTLGEILYDAGCRFSPGKESD